MGPPTVTWSRLVLVVVVSCTCNYFQASFAAVESSFKTNSQFQNPMVSQHDRLSTTKGLYTGSIYRRKILKKEITSEDVKNKNDLLFESMTKKSGSRVIAPTVENFILESNASWLELNDRYNGTIKKQSLMGAIGNNKVLNRTKSSMEMMGSPKFPKETIPSMEILTEANMKKNRNMETSQAKSADEIERPGYILPDHHKSDIVNKKVGQNCGVLACQKGGKSAQKRTNRRRVARGTPTVKVS